MLLVVSYILILKVFLVNLLAALNFANVFFKNKKNVWKIKNVKNVTKIKKNLKTFIHLCSQPIVTATTTPV